MAAPSNFLLSSHLCLDKLEMQKPSSTCVDQILVPFAEQPLSTKSVQFASPIPNPRASSASSAASSLQSLSCSATSFVSPLAPLSLPRCLSLDSDIDNRTLNITVDAESNEELNGKIPKPSGEVSRLN
ncbi:hypothetical protein GYMLUDRAFT_64345 [Collybiopsis luxurians FD-317 M1]|uniref:Uncharacterized protein n=1 Tax=Collybiopsis luxurians FD-317 M1 TaxID=944289 RepID=A0A0D0BCL0_9AGAR|nr:hypothetical protein GYMLUDRAFT_64345 [Collybiopsis luxurians FD-317 M1]